MRFSERPAGWIGTDAVVGAPPPAMGGAKEAPPPEKPPKVAAAAGAGAAAGEPKPYDATPGTAGEPNGGFCAGDDPKPPGVPYAAAPGAPNVPKPAAGAGVPKAAPPNVAAGAGAAAGANPAVGL